MPEYQDPAERDTFLRYIYHGWRPTRFGRVFNRIQAWLASKGFLPDIIITLLTRNAEDGSMHSTVLALAQHEGQPYLVSMLGEQSVWVRNVRETDGLARIDRGKHEAVHLTEVSPSERAPILKAWCQTATSGRRHIPVPYDAPVSDFQSIASQYPVFHIEPATQANSED